MLPADDVALRVEPGAQPMDIERPILAALDVVLARPYELHGLVTADRLGDRGSLAGHVALESSASPEAAAGQQGVDAHLRARHAERAGKRGLIERVTLRAGTGVA